MALIQLPSYLKSISGRVGDAVLYDVGETHLMRRYVIPRNPDTPAQRERRQLFASTVKAWQDLRCREKSRWNALAAGKSYSGFNMFISERMRLYTLEAIRASMTGGISYGDASLLLRTLSASAPSLPHISRLTPSFSPPGP